MRTTMLVVPSDESDLPLFDDVKKGESYLLRETPYFVYLYFLLLDILILYLYLCLCGHVLVYVGYALWTCVFHFYFMT